MKFLSICSGIDAASVAFNPLGWEAVGFSEIEPFPCAVLAHRYPSVPNFGDMTKFAEWPEDVLVQADAVVGGPPCQAFSVAGKREGLNDARGNLTLTYVDLINHVDSARALRGLPPAVVLYENVPGLLSDSTNAFGCFLGALAGEDVPLEPPGGKWTYAGVVSGPQRTIAWRTLDAQFFGVPQRRRRVFVVASARTDIDPTAILFEFDGVRRDTAPSRQAGQEIAPCVTSGAGNGGAAHGARSGSAKDNLIVPVGGRPDVGQPYAVANCLPQRMYKGINSTLDEGQTPVLASRSSQSGVRLSDTHATLDANNGPTVQKVASLSDTAQCLRARTPGHIDNSSTTVVLQPPAAFGAFKGGQGASAGSIGWDEHVSPTLNSADSGSNRTPTLLTHTQVRRHTPVECERLQGFPDNYTLIPWRKKPADRCPDGPRYKALGNSWAVPVVRWIGQRIAHACAHNLITTHA